MAKRHKNISANDLKNYAAGSLSPAQQHDIERDILNEPLWSAAAEGFEALQKNNINTTPHLQDLQVRLQERITKNEQQAVVWWQSQPLRWAAVAVLISGMVGWFLYEPTPAVITQISQIQAPPVTQPTPKIVEKQPEKVIEKNETLAQNIKTKNDDNQIVKNNFDKKSDTYTPQKQAQIDAIVTETATESLAEVAPPAPTSTPTEKATITAKKTPPTIQGRGVVLDENGQPLPGVAISALKSKIMVNSGVNGAFEMKNLQPKDSIQIAFIGYETMKVPVRDSDFGKLRLVPDLRVLSEVVVTDYKEQIVRKVLAQKPLPEPTVGWAQYDTYLAQRLLKLVGKGEVELLFLIRKNGRPSKVKVLSSSVAIPADSLLKILKDGPKFTPSRNSQGRTIKKGVIRKISF